MIYILSIAYRAYIIHIVNPTSVPKVDTTKQYFRTRPIFLNLMVSQYDFAKQNNLRQFSFLNVEPCKQAPSDIQHTRTQTTVMSEQKQKESKPSNAKHM